MTLNRCKTSRESFNSLLLLFNKFMTQKIVKTYKQITVHIQYGPRLERRLIVAIAADRMLMLPAFCCILHINIVKSKRLHT